MHTWEAVGWVGSHEHIKQRKFECVQQVCYDTGHATLEYGHNPGPQILLAKKKRQQAQKHLEKTATSPETSGAIWKKGAVGAF